MRQLYIKVLLPLPLQNPIYTYIVEEKYTEERLKVGQLVVVPFGKGDKKETGIVWEILEDTPKTSNLHYKKVYQKLSYEPLPKQILNLWQWVANYYMYSLGEIFNAAVPNTFRPTIKVNSEEKTKEYRGHIIRGWVLNRLLLGDGDSIIQLKEKLKRSKSTLEALERLLHIPQEELSPPLSLKLWQERLGVSIYTVQKLKEAGILIEDEVLLSDILQSTELRSVEQADDLVSQKIKDIVTERTLLIHYPHSQLRNRLPIGYILEALKKGEQLLLLLPSIEAIVLIEKFLKRDIPAESLWAYHSEATPHKKDKAWIMALEGSAGLFFGLRSAVWLPFKQLSKVIIIDEEDTGYRQYEPAPHFTASRVAQMLAHFSQANVVMVSNTTSIESYTNALRQKYHLINVENNNPPIKLVTVDMGEAYEKNKVVARLLSFELSHAIDEANLAKETTLLLYQRKGYAKRITCGDCGTSCQCSQCHTTYRYYAQNHRLVCPMCGHNEPFSQQCPACGKPSLQATGTGIERLLEAVKERYRGIEVLHYRQGGYLPKAKGARIIIADSYTAPLLPLQEAMVIGIVQLDLLTQRFTFRANELAYRLLCKCIEEAPQIKQIVVQYFAKGQNALTAWKNDSYRELLDHELKERHCIGFPPFSRQIDICFECCERKIAVSICKNMAMLIPKELPNCILLDPAPLPSTKKDTDIGYKLTLLVPINLSSESVKERLKGLREYILNTYRGPQIKIYFDVDPE